MKINKVTSHPKKKISIIIISVIALFLIGAAGWYYFAEGQNRTSSNANSDQKDNIDLNEPSTEQTETGNDAKQDAIDNAENPQQSQLAITINGYAKTGSMTHIGVDIQNVINDGTCSLTVKNGATEKQYTSEIQPLAQYSTCKGFEITNSDLGNGTWEISATVTNQGTSSTATSTLKVGS